MGAFKFNMMYNLFDKYLIPTRSASATYAQTQALTYYFYRHTIEWVSCVVTLACRSLSKSMLRM